VTVTVRWIPLVTGACGTAGKNEVARARRQRASRRPKARPSSVSTAPSPRACRALGRSSARQQTRGARPRHEL